MIILIVLKSIKISQNFLNLNNIINTNKEKKKYFYRLKILIKNKFNCLIIPIDHKTIINNKTPYGD